MGKGCSYGRESVGKHNLERKPIENQDTMLPGWLNLYKLVEPVPTARIVEYYGGIDSAITTKRRLRKAFKAQTDSKSGPLRTDGGVVVGFFRNKHDDYEFLGRWDTQRQKWRFEECRFQPQSVFVFPIGCQLLLP